MKEKFLFLVLMMLLIPSVASACSEGQVDINSASLEELDQIYGIGTVKAQAVIDTRPFDNLNDLINVYGIGEVTLQKIVEQELACVNNNEEETNEEKIEKENEENSTSDKIEKTNKSIEPVIKDTLILNPQTIKTENETEKQDHINLANQGFLIFCFLLLILILFKKWKTQKISELY